jgi:hypothetical protein
MSTSQFEKSVHLLQERITDAFLSTLSQLSPLRAEDFGSLLRSTLPNHMRDGILAALRASGWLVITRNGKPVDLDKTSPHNGDIVTFTSSTPNVIQLRKACES